MFRILPILLLTGVCSLGLAQPAPDTLQIPLPGAPPLSFTRIPAGSFLMGSPEDEAGRDGDESPQREVTFSAAFYLGTFEVTQAQWLAVMGENPAQFQHTPQHLQHPVETVSWADCQEFIYRLQRLGLGLFRLPTEAEWEYACRASTTTRFYWGDDPEEWQSHQYGWINSRSHAATHVVGIKQPNPWGLYDMAGNVWEWCQDTYAPYDGSPARRDTLKVFRGGSWYDFIQSQRSANRHKHGLHERFPAIGLRLVLEQRLPTRRLPLAGDQTISFVHIPAGKFVMGSDSSDVFYQGDEFPAHEVVLTRDFWLGQFEVTQAQYEAVMGYNPAVFQRLPQAGDRPVDMLSWDDCQTFIAQLNTLGLGNFRLPTEAEWEYACRAGTNTLFSWGDDLAEGPMLAHAWYNSRAEGRSHPVGFKKPNSWGLFDMCGGVWEWCQDWLGPYQAEAQTDPQGPEEGTRRVYRGGSWFNEPEALRPANRHGHPPDTRGTNSGLRLVWEP
ncbi:MAG: formylglycine-generating enzyme family protein [Bacteroidetes bacterium]|nr:MAG: formylglycine-generating enzyme family protein [Bacteroidota bacterium]